MTNADRSARAAPALLRLLGLLVAVGLLATACGDSDDSDEGGGAETTEGGDVEAGQDTTPEGTGDGTETTAEEGAAGEAVHGGRLVYGLEADSANPWAHYATSCAISCLMVYRTVADTLYIYDENGEPQPNLVESAEPNEDFTQWTLTVRDGITFHDGTPLTGEAVAYNLLTCRASALTGPAFTFVSAIQGSGQTVTITLTQPSPTLLHGLADGSCAFMMSEEWLRSLPNNPLRNPASPFFDQDTADTPAEGDPTAIVGTGPFVFDSYTPGNGNSFLATRNPDYWRGDGPGSLTGEGLPYLDEVELVVAVDVQSRSNGLQSGQFDIVHTSNSDEIARFAGDGEFVTLQADEFAETNYILLNVGQGTNPTLATLRGVDTVEMDPTGINADSPLLVESCRRALAHAIDNQRLADERGAGIVTPANGPFPPGSAGYLEDTGYPEFDPTAAQAEMEGCLGETGTGSIEFSFNTTNDPFNVETNTLIASMWTDAFGDQVTATIQPIEQGQYIGLALAGVFQAQGWRNHGGIDPGQQWLWWSSATASPINPTAGELALNFGRFQDREIDAAITTMLTSPDLAVRTAAAEDINRAFGEHVYNWWTTWTVWGIISDPAVQDVTALTVPDSGAPVLPVISGRHWMAQIWCTDGDCGG